MMEGMETEGIFFRGCHVSGLVCLSRLDCHVLAAPIERRTWRVAALCYAGRCSNDGLPGAEASCANG